MVSQCLTLASPYVEGVNEIKSKCSNIYILLVSKQHEDNAHIYIILMAMKLSAVPSYEGNGF